MDSLKKSSLFSLVFASQATPYQYSSQSSVRDCLSQRFLRLSSHWTVYRTASPFTRRVTALQWHPTYNDVVAVGSHGGDILLWKYDKPGPTDPQIKGVGMGYGSITEMRFHPQNPTLIYTTAVDGRFCLQDFNGRCSEVFLDTMDIRYWWCSFDISQGHDVIFVGNNCGGAMLLDSNGQTIGRYMRIHKGKIKHIEFCPARSWTVATASVDKTVALWDIRMLKENCCNNYSKSTEPLAVMSHNAPISSAYFDPMFGSRLLTTSQNGEIRVYDPYDWETPATTIEHSHRHFQHITDIKATWHPLYNDLCVIGRYPCKEDPDQSRTIDLMDLKSGERVGYLYSPHIPYIVQLNQFNKTGDSLASGMGYSVAIWKAPEDTEAVLEMARKEAQSKEKRPIPLPHDSDGGRASRRPRRKRECDKDEALKKKKKLLEQVTKKKKMMSLVCTSTKKKH